MIPFSFIYYRPDSLKEATEVYSQLQSEGKNVVYYAGGSEIITMSRSGAIQPDAVIDLKTIPECRVLYADDRALHIGAACTLNQIKMSERFPFLGLAGGRVADHTNQCRITLGGNLCGTIIYRETSLPLLLSDAEVTLCDAAEQRTVPFQSVFHGQMQLRPGEMVVQVHIPLWALQADYAHFKKTANEKIDYPLVNVSALWHENNLRVAFSGICSYPFRSEDIECVLNDHSLSCNARAKKAVALLPEPAMHDAEGSGDYRRFVMENTLLDLLKG